MAISTEVYYYDEYNISDGLALIKQQYNWLKQDLQVTDINIFIVHVYIFKFYILIELHYLFYVP